MVLKICAGRADQSTGPLIGMRSRLSKSAFCIHGVNQLYIQSMARNLWVQRAGRLHHSMPFYTGDLSVRGGPGTNTLQIWGASRASLGSTGWAVCDFRFFIPRYACAVITCDSGLLPSPASPHESHLLKDPIVGYSFTPVSCLAFILLELLVRTQSSSQIHYASFRLRLLHRITAAFVTIGTPEISAL